MSISFFFALVIGLSQSMTGTYFPNWAQYRQGGYAFTADSLKPIIDKLDIVWYGFAYFCPDSSMIQPYWVTQMNLCSGKQPFQIVPIEPKDPEYYQTIVGYKSINTNLKVVLSIGGWNFPSNFFSGMISSATNRQVFINSALSMMNQYGFDGIDIDWEYPCSPNRTDEVKITCQDFDKTIDEGGKCPDDKDNLTLLIKEMRAAFGNDKIISIAAQADKTKAETGFNITALSQYIDYWNIMDYDYSVSDIDDGNVTAPNQPLYAPSSAPEISQDAVASTVDFYLSMGVDPKTINIGIAYYGHLWYVPGLTTQEQWGKYGLTATVQSECCGPMAPTYGAKYGQYSELCGTYMYSEIIKAGFDIVIDPETKAVIGYATNPIDGWTKPGTWISYQDPSTIDEIIAFAQQKGLNGAFAFDISMDDTNFTLTKEIYSALN